jgi:hypothetical protein
LHSDRQFDPAKSAANKGSTYVEAQALWSDPDRIELARSLGHRAFGVNVDWDKARRPGREVQRVNVDFPMDLLRAIDREARRIGVTRQAFIKLRLADTLERY